MKARIGVWNILQGMVLLGINIHYVLDRNNSVCFAVYVAMLTNSQVLRMHAEINLYAQVDVKAI